MATNTKSPRPTRRWLRFSLRGLFIAVTILCIWLSVKINTARKQKEAVAAILKARGEVFYDYQVTPSSPGSPAADLQAAMPNLKIIRPIMGQGHF